MTITDEPVDKLLQLAETGVIDAHHWGTGPVVAHLDAMKHYAIPALQLCDPTWLDVAKGALGLALDAAENLVAELTKLVTDFDAAIDDAKRYQP